jgi:hypothetical protein
VTEQIAELLEYVAGHPRRPVGYMAGRLRLDEYRLRVLLNTCVYKGWLIVCATCSRTLRYEITPGGASALEAWVTGKVDGAVVALREDP